MDVITSPIEPARIADIEREAGDILAKLGLTTPPINIFDVASRLGVDVFFAMFADSSVEASVIKRAGHAEISVAPSSPVRRRFSVAHELGHLALHLAGSATGQFADRAVEFRRSSAVSLSGDPKEAEANRFAAALLMPAAWVRTEAAKTSDVAALCAVFDVSNEAMRRRLTELGLG